MNRRCFLSGAAAFAASRPWRLFAETGESQPMALDVAGATPDLRFGVVSDVHVREATGQYGTEALVKAFSWFRDQGADGVVIAGDMADFGLVSQLQCIADAWNKVFPRDKGLDGRHVEKLFIYGNHDIEGFKYSKIEPKPDEIIATDRAAAWERVFGEPYVPIWKKTVKGYTFIGAHWDGWKGVPSIEPYMKERAAELCGDRPFFYIQHPHPKGTCHGGWAWGQDDGFATRALSRFPNAIAFSGHSHHPLVDERAIWQGAFTSIGTASLRYIDPVYGRENAGPSALDDLKQMPMLDRFGGKEGLLVSVYPGCVVVRRRDIVCDGDLGPDWVIPLPSAGPKPFDFAARGASAAPPEFPSGAKAVVRGPFDGKDRKGRASKQIEVSFPAATAGDGRPRAYDYEVAAEVEESGARRIAKSKRVYSPTYFLAPEREIGTVRCVFSVNELGTRKAKWFNPKVRFVVRAAESFGNPGRTLASNWHQL